MKTKTIEKYFFFGLLLATFIFSLFIFKPFWEVLVLSISFSILLYPIYEWLNKIKFPNWLSALLTVLIFILVIGGLLWGAGIVILNQSQSVYNLIANNGNTLSFLNSANNSIAKALPAGISFNLNQKISDFISFITNNIAGIFTFTLSTLLYFLLTSLSIFYILKDSAHWKKAIKLISPLSDKDNDKIIDKLSLAVNGVMKGYFSIVFIQGALVSLGFVLFKVPNPALWGLMAFIASFVPAIGSALVSIPIVIFLFVTGHSIEAVGLALWALAMVGTIDILLNPIIVGKKANLHPMLILFSVLGGISLLGPIGLIVGPLVVSLFYTLVSIYRDEFKQESVIS